MNFDPKQFLTSITGVSAVVGISLLATRKFDLASVVFTAVSLGAAGVLWERYSRRAGLPLDLGAITKKRLLEQE